MYQDHKRRWVFGAVVDGKHDVDEYALSCEWHITIDGKALAYTLMNAHQIAAARLDPRLVVLPSLHSHESVPDAVADHHKQHGAARGMRLHDMLLALSKYHPSFEPED